MSRSVSRLLGTLPGKVRAWRNGETGLAEVAGAIVVIPLIFALIFTLIEVGWYLRYRAMVDQVTRSAAMMVAMDGADTQQPWSPLAGASPAAWSTSWSAWGTEQLRKICHNIPAQTTSGGAVTGAIPGGLGKRCEAMPSMTCTPTALPTNAGARVECRAEFAYRPITSMARNTIFNMGFGSLFDRNMTITVESVTSVGSGR